MPLGNTSGCQPGTEKSYGGWTAKAGRCAEGEILRTKISPGFMKRLS